MAWFRFPPLLHRFHHFHLYYQHNNLHNERIYFYIVGLICLFSSGVLVNSIVIDVFSDNGKPIRPVSCFDAKGNKGTCMFSLACRQSKGKPIGICKDTIYAKSCCQLPGDQPQPSNGFTSNIYSTTLPESQSPTSTTKTAELLTTITTLSSSLPSSLPSSPPTTKATQTTTTQAPITKTTPTTGLTSGTNITTTVRPTVTTPLVEKESSSTSTMLPTVNLSSISSTTIGQTIADHPSSITPLTVTLPTTMISTSSSFLTDTVTETVITEILSSLFSTSTDFNLSSPSTKLSKLSTEISSVSLLANSSSQSITSTTATPATLPDSEENLSNKILNLQQRPYNNKLDCGVSPLKPMARVVGGRNAHFGEWPWQVLIKEATWLGLRVKTKCGGVLIDHRWVLTAAHCQPGFSGSLLVVVGEYDLTRDVENLKPIQKAVKRMIVHRNYNPTTFENDIALMELESPFDVQPHVVPICLPGPGEEFVGQVAHVAGWGKLSYDGPIPSILQVVKLPILANDECQEMFNNASHDKDIKSTFLCAGYTDGGKDSCEGDSGGPLMVQKSNGHWVLVGTVSHGFKCAEPNLPGVYMKTAAYKSWIDNIINKTVKQNNINQTGSNDNNNSKIVLKT